MSWMLWTVFLVLCVTSLFMFANDQGIRPHRLLIWSVAIAMQLRQPLARTSTVKMDGQQY
ncbi:hypothetical protein COCSUDRAFT_33582 [Coccomyxa subellipsoidea C-169]|uniref:Uncharacterized protein n=1 Tax=Coccomyxa subellipsoidea (strain C-169) TaxID=574566 RepID=I0YU64_COCSC|nr:hypothetical protein COCSUDRAFT_33582 [Coccomyxa subellipsoidea C-169]EIE21933.1 hypothetical protein COCSUDRAFT_33582 [Coccomyxa subellipsoidea C-169]|eukprot:XP_005646477.1 hypothetical protein COCSUDRAFT_33582 [Coccomyxa subellipsoidea C-169]